MVEITRLLLIGMMQKKTDSFVILTIFCRTLNELSGTLASKNISFQENPISVERFGNLIDLVQGGTITGKYVENVHVYFKLYMLIYIYIHEYRKNW